MGLLADKISQLQTAGTIPGGSTGRPAAEAAA
jgi:hypothetical protein